MNFKKFISGVSALAIAASAFAGINALAFDANVTSPYALSSNEYIDNVLIGTAVKDADENVTSVTAEDFSSSTSGAYTSSSFTSDFDTRDSGKTVIGNQYASHGLGYGITIPCDSDNASKSYLLTAPVTSGKVVFRGEITTPLRDEYVEITGTNQNGDSITVFRFASTNDRGRKTSSININGTNKDGPYIHGRGYGATVDYVVIDLTTGKVDYECSGMSWSSSVPESTGYLSKKTDSATISDLASVTGIKVGVTSACPATQTTTLDNVQMYTVASTTVSHKVTVRYVDEDDNDIAAQTTVSVENGKSYTVNDFNTTFDDDNYRYTYIAADSTLSANNITSDVTLKVVYSKAALAEHTVTAKAIGDYEATLGVYTVKDAKSVTYPFSKYILSGTTLYSTETSGTNTYYKKTVSNVTENVESTVTYTTTSKTNVVYYADGADASGLTATEAGNIGIRCSNGTAGYAETDATITTLPAGKYKITIAPYGNQGTTFMAYAGSKDTDALVKAPTSANITEHTSDEFVLSDDTDIIIAAAGNAGSSPKVIDYIYIVRTDDYTAPATNTMGDVATTVLTKGDGVKTFAAQAATWVNGGTDGASVWEATVTGDGTSYTTIKAIAEKANGEKTEGTADLRTLFTDASVTVCIAVNAAMEDITSLTVSVE